MMENRHILVLCAYKESKYLEDCIVSLKNQTLEAPIIISTSTPNEHILGLAEKYGVEVMTHSTGNMAQDNFNYALSNVDAQYITLCHQDDIYEEDYVKKIQENIYEKGDIILFTDYYEIRNDNKIFTNKLLKIKRFMNIGFKISKRSRFIRNRVLSFGNPICCPSVTFCMNVCKGFEFSKEYKNSFDWEAWCRLAGTKGRFVYISRKLVGHRIHAESGTTENIRDNSRYNDDMKIYHKYWPKWIAEKLMKKYAKGMDSN